MGFVTKNFVLCPCTPSPVLAVLVLLQLALRGFGPSGDPDV